jgi:hypothetical protein
MQGFEQERASLLRLRLGASSIEPRYATALLRYIRMHQPKYLELFFERLETTMAADAEEARLLIPLMMQLPEERKQLPAVQAMMRLHHDLSTNALSQTAN